MTVRGIARRRASLALLLALPLLFYLVRHELPGQSVRFLALGLAWAASTLALFAALAARESEPRLRLNGWSWLALAYLALGAVDRQVDRTLAVGLMLAVTACIGVVTGTALGAAVKRELEGALALFIIAGLQFMADPPTLLAHLLPFWSTRELGTWAIDGPDAASLGAAFTHAGATLALGAALTVALTARRRPR